MKSENAGFKFEVREQLSDIIYLIKKHTDTLPKTLSYKKYGKLHALNKYCTIFKITIQMIFVKKISNPAHDIC